MNLSGAIVEHQNSLLQLYRKLEERFEENGVIRTFWRDMTGDISLQIQSIKAFPPSLWNQLKSVPGNSFESAVKSVKEDARPPSDISSNSLRDCFEISLRLTEPVVLKIYARIIRMLRQNSTAPALNFYILVKTYVARLVRSIDSFTGDPLLIRRAQLLIVGLEKEVQEPAPEIRTPASAPLPAKTKKAPAPVKTDAKAAQVIIKTPPGNVKTSALKPAKTSSEKPKTFSEKTPATTKRARR
jgi:hypothetical protein